MSSYHSETVAYYLARARNAIREASAAHRRREVPTPTETPPHEPEESDDA